MSRGTAGTTSAAPPVTRGRRSQHQRLPHGRTKFVGNARRAHNTPEQILAAVSPESTAPLAADGLAGHQRPQTPGDSQHVGEEHRHLARQSRDRLAALHASPVRCTVVVTLVVSGVAVATGLVTLAVVVVVVRVITATAAAVFSSPAPVATAGGTGSAVAAPIAAAANTTALAAAACNAVAIRRYRRHRPADRRRRCLHRPRNPGTRRPCF